MSRTTVRRTIDAPSDFVFRTVAEIENFSTAIPHIVDVEFLLMSGAVSVRVSEKHV